MLRSMTRRTSQGAATLVATLLLSLAGCVNPSAPPAAARTPATSAPVQQASGQSSLRRAPEAVERAIEELLEKGDRALAETRLTTPADDNALDHYLHVLVLAPGEPRALAGIDRISESYQALALRSASAGASSAARRWLDLAEQVAPAHPGLAITSGQIERRAALPVRRVALDSAALAAGDRDLAERLAGLGTEAKEQSLFVVIRTPRDDWGRWIYQQMNAAPPALRLRARSEIGQPPALELSPTSP